MGNRLLQKYSVPGQPRPRLPAPQSPLPGPRQPRIQILKQPGLPIRLLEQLAPEVCYQLASAFPWAGGRVGGLVARAICKYAIPTQQGTIYAGPRQPPLRGPVQPGGQPTIPGPRQPGPQRGPQPIEGQVPSNPRLGQPSGGPGGQGPGTGNGQPSQPPGGQGPTSPAIPVTTTIPNWPNVPTTSFPGYPLPPPEALVNAAAVWAWNHGTIVWDSQRGIFWSNIVCDGPFCHYFIAPGKGKLVAPYPVNDPHYKGGPPSTGSGGPFGCPGSYCSPGLFLQPKEVHLAYRTITGKLGDRRLNGVRSYHVHG